MVSTEKGESEALYRFFKEFLCCLCTPVGQCPDWMYFVWRKHWTRMSGKHSSTDWTKPGMHTFSSIIRILVILFIRDPDSMQAAKQSQNSGQKFKLKWQPIFLEYIPSPPLPVHGKIGFLWIECEPRTLQYLWVGVIQEIYSNGAAWK